MELQPHPCKQCYTILPLDVLPFIYSNSLDRLLNAFLCIPYHQYILRASNFPDLLHLSQIFLNMSFVRDIRTPSLSTLHLTSLMFWCNTMYKTYFVISLDKTKLIFGLTKYQLFSEELFFD